MDGRLWIAGIYSLIQQQHCPQRCKIKTNKHNNHHSLMFNNAGLNYLSNTGISTKLVIDYKNCLDLDEGRLLYVRSD
jgi:hypothetical protein